MIANNKFLGMIDRALPRDVPQSYMSDSSAQMRQRAARFLSYAADAKEGE